MALAFEKFGLELEKQQEVVAGIADVIMEMFAMESAQLRSQKTGMGADMCAVLLRDAHGAHRDVRAPGAGGLLPKATRCARTWRSCGASRNTSRWIRSRSGGASPNGCSAPAAM